MIAWWVAAALAEPVPVEAAVDVSRRAMAAALVDDADLSFVKDYVDGYGVKRDLWKVPGIEDALHDPLSVPAEAEQLAASLAKIDGKAPMYAEFLGQLWTDQPIESAYGVGGECAFTLRGRLADLEQLLCDVDAELLMARHRVDEALQDVPAIAIEATLPAFDPAGEQPPEALAAHLEMDRRALADALILTAQTAEALETAATELDPRVWPRTPLVLQGHSGTIVVGTLSDDALLLTDTALVLDPGGDDVYGGRGGRVSVVVDLAGDDLHRASAAVGSVATAIDTSGNDIWTGEAPGPAGAVFGASLLVDREGDDTYRATAWSQGGAEHGIAALIDLAGDDTYEAGIRSQAYAGVGSVGLLYDAGGNDHYAVGGVFSGMPHYPDRTHSMGQGFSIGARPIAAGGLAALVDEAGNDHYQADLFAQGSAYWLGRGYAIDHGGDDVWEAHHYVHGAAVHLGVGGLFESNGNDSYTSHGLAGGAAHDYSVAWFIEGEGDDKHQTEDTSAVGVGITNSVAFHIDLGGDDTQNMPGRIAPRRTRSQGTVGVFVDVGGNDTRGEADVDNGEILRPGAGTVALDLETPADLPVPTVVELPLRRESRPATEDAKTHIEGTKELDAVCTDGAATDEEIPDANALSPLLGAMRRDTVMDGYCLANRVRALAEEMPAGTRDALVQWLEEPGEVGAMRWPTHWLRHIEANDDTWRVLGIQSRGPNFWVRIATAETIGALGSDPEHLLDVLAADSDEAVRAAAVAAMEPTVADAATMAKHLSDPSFLVRFNAAGALVAHPDRRGAVRAVRDLEDSERPVVRWLRMEVLSQLGEEEDAAAIAEGDEWATWHLEREPDLHWPR